MYVDTGSKYDTVRGTAHVLQHMAFKVPDDPPRCRPYPRPEGIDTPAPPRPLPRPTPPTPSCSSSCPMPYAPPCFDVTLPVPDWAELSEHVAPEGGADV